MIEDIGDAFQDTKSFIRYFRTDAVAGQNSESQVHAFLFYCG
jgi:hypothetical protein